MTTPPTPQRPSRSQPATPSKRSLWDEPVSPSTGNRSASHNVFGRQLRESVSEKFLPTLKMPVPSLRKFVLGFLPVLSVMAVYCCWVVSFNNGYFRQLKEVFFKESHEHEQPSFPETEEALVQRYTGIGLVDKQLSLQVAFFAPVVHNVDKSLGLFILWAFGQFGGAWTLLVMETLRAGNQKRMVSFIGIFGVLFQSFSFAVVTPIYLLLHLVTSPISKPFPSTHASTVLLVLPHDIRVLPFSITLGYILPSILMMCHGASSWPLGSSTHQKLIASWQMFPIWTVMTHWLLKRLYLLFNKQRSQDSQKVSPTSPSIRYLRSARWVYIFILSFCISTHLPALFLAVSPKGSHLLERIPLLSAFANETTFPSVFIPPYPFGDQQVRSLAAGAHIFLGWDAYISSAACLLWGLVLYCNASSESEIVDPSVNLPVYRELLAGARERKVKRWQKLVARVLFWTVLAGPLGTLTVLLWERDAIVKQKVKQGI